MSSRWTHSVCEKCWKERSPDREPIRTMDETPEKCCWCGAVTGLGIFQRADPATVPCLGEHEPDTHDDGEGPRPHEYRCPGCYKHRVCWACGSSLRVDDSGRCTNGTCGKCHYAGKCGAHPG